MKMVDFKSVAIGVLLTINLLLAIGFTILFMRVSSLEKQFDEQRQGSRERVQIGQCE